MILECAACRTRYLVPDTAIGPDGRTVRCANCKHSWFQEGAGAEALAAGLSATPAPSVTPPPAATVPPVGAPAVETDYDAFGYQAPFRPRRNPARRYTMIAVAAGVTMLIGVGVISASGATGLASQFGLIAAADTQLRIEQNPIDRHDLPSGSEAFAVSGRIVNPTGKRLPVTDLRADLLDAQGRQVYTWTITPEARVVGPRGVVEFRSLTLDVPNNGKALRLSFASGAAG
ncbi:MAG: zinc-ribbon domain-containing protein [Sphingomonas sp.]|nr:zinc-ribbon domain-containing protein [Sphingomonas sp.]